LKADAITRALRTSEPTSSRRSVLVGLLGRGIKQSRSPAMHEAEGAAQGLTYVYRLFDTAAMDADVAIGDILRAAELCGFAGINVTYPYKVDVIAHLDELSPAARAVGAVNTIVFRNGKRSGHNTDLWGFTESFRRGLPAVKRASVLQLGAGGAGAAVAHALANCGVEQIQIFDKVSVRAEELAAKINDAHGAERAVVLAELRKGFADRLDGIVNTTPMGMATMPGAPVPDEFIEPHLWIADIVYFPLETEFLRIGRSKGCRVLPGSGMAVFQAVRAFEHFTGLTPDVARMEAAFNDYQEEEPR
jgi:shikimate dehydrogenase